jgi:hypothetical protein
MHELHRLPDAVLVRLEECTAYEHHVHEKYGAIDLETWVKNSTLVVDIHAEMESRGLEIRQETARGWEQAELDDGTRTAATRTTILNPKTTATPVTGTG